MPRLFIAIDLPERIRDDLSDLYTAIPGARWVDENQFHLTLRFLGEISHDSAGQVENSLRLVKGHPFSLRIRGTGYFPPRNQPKVLWAGVTECEDLMRLQARIDRQVISVPGVQQENRKFHPHITLARLADTPPREVARFVTENSLFSTEEFAVSEFHLYESVIGRERAVHTVRESYKLTKN